MTLWSRQCGIRKKGSGRSGRRHVLILSKDLRAPGGVVNFISSLISHSSRETQFCHMPIGRGVVGWRARFGFVSPVFDNVILALTALVKKPDLIHINPSFNYTSLVRDGLFIITAKLVSRAPLIILFHGWNSSHADFIKEKTLLSWLFKKVYSKPALTLVLASSFEKELLDLGLQPKRIKVVTTMFDGELFAGVKRSSSNRYRKILFLSRYVREKGVYEVLEAYYLLVKEFSDVKLVMAGDGPEKDGIQKWVAQRSLQHDVDIKGYVRGVEKAQLLMDSDIFVFPSYYGEGCPVAVLEAMAAGLGIVSSDAGGLADIFKDNKNGVLTEDVSADAVAAALRRLLYDTSFLDSVKAYNRLEAWSKYEAPIVSGEIEGVYRSLTEGATGAGL